MRWLFAALSLVGLLALSSTASARSFRVQDIPNGDQRTCLNCHGELAAQTFNDFGSRARANLEEGGAIQEAHVIWADLCAEDSDQDGESNGVELGDPDCAWRRGDPNSGADTSNPGTDSSTPPPVCGNFELDVGEQCEGVERSVTDCLQLDAGEGVLKCKDNCSFDYTGCSEPPLGEGFEDGDGGGEEEGCTLSRAHAGSTAGPLAALALLLGLTASCVRGAVTRPRRRRAAASDRALRRP